jgi:acyl-CoA synthetase (AMP-forming)/AMP-acid ligase II
LDPHLHPVAPGSGTIGRLARRGHIPLGYRNDPDRTRATFPVVDGERWAIPGDLATVEADGHIVLLGRGSDVINSGGEKVFPDEVEATLLEHPSVAEAVVVGVDDPRWGERVTAVVVPRHGRRVVPEDLERHCRSRLAAFKVPRTYHVTEKLRHTVANKSDRAWARALAAQQS